MERATIAVQPGRVISSMVPRAWCETSPLRMTTVIEIADCHRFSMSCSRCLMAVHTWPQVPPSRALMLSLVALAPCHGEWTGALPLSRYRSGVNGAGNVSERGVNMGRSVTGKTVPGMKEGNAAAARRSGAGARNIA